MSTSKERKRKKERSKERKKKREISNTNSNTNSNSKTYNRNEYNCAVSILSVVSFFLIVFSISFSRRLAPYFSNSISRFFTSLRFAQNDTILALCHPFMLLRAGSEQSEGSGIWINVRDSSLRCASFRMTTSAREFIITRIIFSFLLTFGSIVERGLQGCVLIHINSRKS